VALGYQNLSMPVTGIGPVKHMLLALDAAKLTELIIPNISIETRLSTLRDKVNQFCFDTGVPI